ncbi:hypothetical protein [Gluconobacter cerinus]|uniref:Uncharacterized protein n=1 Tax=Gluconobacter cerinus TaxID=38307 RepID=A0A1B6VKH8_9PROT|nr:hypothetical protein [Gluconobacter cerinus]OAJ67729.1 hypothetical protein A0123_01771 [Gluconobacter cerinus]
MSEPTELDCLLNPEPVCPYCGHKDRDWWDSSEPLADEDIVQMECGSCEREYTVSCSIEILFTTAKTEDDL